MIRTYKTIFLLLIPILDCYCHDDILVEIDQGTLKGYVANDYFGQPYYGFQSIPYAAPPLGPLRFQNPIPAKSWSPKILDATIPNSICVQWLHDKYLNGSEDCLYLHVYTKNLQDKKSVMVWIHGGGLISGSVYDGYGPEFLMTQDIVLVLVQYRLGYCGFLSIDDPAADVPGNFGFKDQVLALKWVQKNIEKFGGDPNQVTIFGESAGGTSVHLHIFSAASTGLFHRAIIQSDTTNVKKVRDSKYREFAEALNCTNETIEKLLSCLQQRTTEEIMVAQKGLVQFKTFSNGVLGYTIEPKRPGAFLTKPLENILEQKQFNQVPIISGFVKDDGTLGYLTEQRAAPNFTDPEDLIPSTTNLRKHSPESIIWANRIKKFYYGSTEPSYENIEPYIKYQTDTLILFGAYKYSKQVAKISKYPVFFYEFNYHSELNPNLFNYSRPLVQHADDDHYLFVYKRTPKHMNPESDAFIGVHRMITFWTTFAKTGNPNPRQLDPLIDVEWKPIVGNVFNYLEISPKMAARINPANERMEFWTKFSEQCNCIDF